ncbi:hypothetical protein H0W26_05180 [Candidatus Dependentiae bacterium]|nr:hypothetical protein [Candidatus Dependentiae bacterium]
MKRILSIVVLAGATLSLSADHMDMSSGRSSEKTGSHEMMHQEMMKDMMSFKNKVKGKTFELPGSLEKDVMTVKSSMLKTVAESLRDCGKLNFKSGSSEMKKYDQAAEKAEALAESLQSLPIKKTMKKKFDKVDDWMKFMVQEKQIKARLVKEVAKQLNDPEMKKKADKFASMVDKFSTKMTDKSTADEDSDESTTGEKSDESTAGEESEESKESTGCPVNDDADQESSQEEEIVVTEEDQE